MIVRGSIELHAWLRSGGCVSLVVQVRACGWPFVCMAVRIHGGLACRNLRQIETLGGWVVEWLGGSGLRVFR
jgi:hypothetical protein